jgi:hypothetical protein
VEATVAMEKLWAKCLGFYFTSVSYFLYLQVKIIGVTTWHAMGVNILMLLRYFELLNEGTIAFTGHIETFFIK